MTAPTERQQALQELVASDGWKLFLSHVEQQWGPSAVLDRIRVGLSKGDTDTSKYVNAEALLREVMQWPNREFARSEQKQERDTKRRRAR
jgi:hypothetical protein